MNEPLVKLTNRQLVDAVATLCDTIDDVNTPHYSYTILRQAGRSPQAVATRMKSTAEQALAQTVAQSSHHKIYTLPNLQHSFSRFSWLDPVISCEPLFI
jgi:hypothetical protein